MSPKVVFIVSADTTFKVACCNHSKLTSPDAEKFFIEHLQWLLLHQYGIPLVLLQSWKDTVN